MVSGVTTDTAYLLGGMEEVTGGVVTKYLGVSGLPTAIRVGTSGSLNYLTTDGLGSVSEALDGAGNVVAAQLYTPYGQTRYTSGTMPTSKGFTGQRADAVSGLGYYGARYYDPVAQQFTEADTANDGLSRYAYVRGNPETFTDPTGRLRECMNNCGGGDPGGDGDPHNYCPNGICHRHHFGPPPPPPAGPGPKTKPNPCDASCHAKERSQVNGQEGGAISGIWDFIDHLRSQMSWGAFLSHFWDWTTAIGLLAGAILLLAGAIALLVASPATTFAGWMMAADGIVAALDAVVHAVGVIVGIAYGQSSTQYKDYVQGLQFSADALMIFFGALTLTVLSGGTLGVADIAAVATVGSGTALSGFFLLIGDMMAATGFSPS